MKGPCCVSWKQEANLTGHAMAVIWGTDSQRRIDCSCVQRSHASSSVAEFRSCVSRSVQCGTELKCSCCLAHESMPSDAEFPRFGSRLSMNSPPFFQTTRRHVPDVGMKAGFARSYESSLTVVHKSEVALTLGRPQD
jgi:hypothetical protein